MIEVNNLQFTYPGNTASTLKGLNFSIDQGEIFGFLGPSGAGKSTTQKIIIGILKGYQGSVKVQGTEISQITADYYENIGVGFEVPNLYSKLTAQENLSFFSSLYEGPTEKIESWLARVGLEAAADTRVAEFSKGMKVRLSFCRAFLNQPQLVFLDEPTSGLDPVNAQKIKDIILEQKEQGRTIFLTTHDMKVAADLCDRVAFIVEGQIKLIDSPRALKIGHGQKTVKVEYRSADQVKNKEFDLTELGTDEQFLSLIQEEEIETIHTQEPTLDDIFIEVTGRELR